MKGNTNTTDLIIDNISGIDTTANGLIYTFTKGNPGVTTYDEINWTATEDCWVIGSIVHRNTPMTNTTSFVRVNGQTVASCGLFTSLNTVTYAGVCVPVKKGQIVSVRTGAGDIGEVKARKFIK